MVWFLEHLFTSESDIFPSESVTVAVKLYVPFSVIVPKRIDPFPTPFGGFFCSNPFGSALLDPMGVNSQST